ncbi:uncharacterized protein LOC122385288 [Amphibalanus amphitrite]|uniref:uncharacterized protein LOC122385288 n=1 Tax=Amphibalanus amphitrite TaxID=1232801 RepID=UPI001C91A30F|nr:uncharacterized protein LOC122385288 [Amphibalanus amphitrite]
MSLKRQIRSAGVRSTDHLLQSADRRSMSGDRPRSQKSFRGDARSTRSQSRSSVLDTRSPRERLSGDKSNDDLHEKTKEALGNLIVRKDELESKGIETEIMYKELMNCVSPWRRKKLLQESEESQAALDDALKAADELLKQSKEAFDAYQSLNDSKRKDAAAGDLFWKSKVMHKTLTSCIQVACNAESARDQLAWADKMSKIMNSMMAIFQILDDLKHQLSKERALTKSLTSLVQREDGRPLDLRTVTGRGDEDVALLLARAGADRPAQSADLFPSRWSFISGGRLSLLLAAGLVAAGGYWAAEAAGHRPAELLARLLRSWERLLLPAVAVAEPSWLESAQLWMVSLLYSLVCWVPGLCSEAPTSWTPLDALLRPTA